MNDVLDDRMRALMARVEELTSPAPEFESLRSRSVVTRAHRPSVRALVAVAATLVLVIAGLIVIQARRDDVSLTSQRRLTTHSVATALPDGWEIKGAVDGKPDVGAAALDELQVFATAAAPAGPVVGLLPTWAGTGADSATQTNVVLADGRRAALGSTHAAAARSLDVEAAPGHWVGLIARGVSDTDLLAIGTMVVVDAAGSSSFTGALPAGLIATGSTTIFGGIDQVSLATDANQIPLGTALTGYGPVGGALDVSIAAFAPTAADRALLGLEGNVAMMTAVGAPGVTTYAIDFGDRAGVGVFRERDGVGFLARGLTRDVSQLADLLDSLEPVDDATWARLVARRAPDDQSSTQDTTVASTAAPPPTVAIGSVAPTPVDVAYTVTAASDGYDAVAEVPAGTVLMHVRIVGRSTLVDMSLNGELIQSESVDSTSGGSWSSARDPGGSSGYLDIVPAGDRADTLRVTDQDHVYTTKFITIDPTNPVRVAMIVVPPLPGRTTPASGYTYAADGTPLDSL